MQRLRHILVSASISARLRMDTEQERVLPLMTRKPGQYKAKLNVFGVVCLFILVTGLTVLVLTKHTQGERNDIETETQGAGTDGSNDKIITKSLRAHRTEPPEEIGHLNLYIFRKHERRPYRFQVPVARFDREYFPVRDPFISLKPWIPLFEHRYTKETIYYSRRGDVYLLPSLYTKSGKMYSVARLLDSGHVSLRSTGSTSDVTYDIESFFRSQALRGSGIPRINPSTGGFSGGVYSKHNSFSDSDESDHHDDNDDDDDNSYDRSDDHDYRQPVKQRTRTTSRSTSQASTTEKTTTKTTPATDHSRMISDIDIISEYWANARPYKDNKPSYFGVTDIGLPDGCQVEQAHILHRHGSRYPSGGDSAASLIAKIKLVLGRGDRFTGLLTFLNTWSSRLGSEVLVPSGGSMTYQSGVDFWNRYGRLLYNATPGQAYYNETNNLKPLFRTTAVQRTMKSLSEWAAGFFGSEGATNKYSVWTMPISSRANNTLAAFGTCGSAAGRPAGGPPTGNGSSPSPPPLPTSANDSLYLDNALIRLSAFMPADANLTSSDLRSMQTLCAFEYSALGSSDFCSLFTLQEWRCFEQAFSKSLYGSSSFGSPTGRAQGIGYVEELVARLTGNFITVSYSSVNSTLDSSPTTFPLDQPFYMDMAHEFTLATVLTALSLDYFRETIPSDCTYDDHQRYRSSQIVPMGARIITEKIGCISSSPISTKSTRTQYSSTQYGYSPALATHKFVRIRLNNGILPLNTIRGGYCSVGRKDGLCPLDKFVESHNVARTRANYQYVCFANYTVDPTKFDGDGTYFP